MPPEAPSDSLPSPRPAVAALIYGAGPRSEKKKKKKKKLSRVLIFSRVAAAAAAAVPAHVQGEGGGADR